jgi:hypothetical protein
MDGLPAPELLVPTGPLYHASLLVIAVALLACLILADEAGYRLGVRERRRSNDGVRAQVGTIQGALLALFALLLGFTFSMAIERYDLRKQEVVKEANAIGTAALRVRLLPVEQREPATELFRKYVRVRVDATTRSTTDIEGQLALDAEASRLQASLWEVATAAADADARSVSAGLLVQAVNDMIDSKGEQDEARYNTVPETVILLLFGFAVLSIGVVGFGNGLVGSRALGATGALLFLIVLVILLIMDLDRPGRGLIRVSQYSLHKLEQDLSPRP